MMDALLRYETNGNIMVVRQPEKTSTLSVAAATARANSTQNIECGVQGDMTDSSEQTNSCFDSDWNSNNQFLSPDDRHTDQKADPFFQQYSNIRNNANKDFFRKSPTSPASSPIYGVAPLHQKDISYDDLSKNIDANLAEIDMETFRSEDINSILALPAIYSGDFQSESRGEQCASVSGSLLNGLDLDTSARSNRHSEDEISICKDTPLFSPLREPPEKATISVDSLDNSSSYEQDLVLTCKANKNNYTIVFEGSSTQFSDDSDYQDVCRSSEGEVSMSGNVQQVCSSGSFKKQSSMVQSDVSVTTWSKLWKSTRVSSTRRKSYDTVAKISGSKSQSLPNLSHNSVFITDKQLNQWAKWCGNHRFPLYEIVQNYQQTGMHVAGSKDSVSLLKLFMKHKVSSNSSMGSISGQSDSTTSLILQPLNFRNASLQNSLNDKVKPLQRHGADDKHQKKGHNDNETRAFVDNILDWNSVQNLTEANNNNINNTLYNNTENAPNNNNVEEPRATADDCDNSQYFEDSLMDNPSPPLKHFHATPIKEEEETDISSGDEVMRDSKNPFGSDESSSGEITVIQNNVLDNNQQRQENHNLERINNIFPSIKTNKAPSIPETENHSQSTQTKQFNINEGAVGDVYKPLHTFSCKTSSNQTDCDTVNTVQYTHSRDSSPASSGYVSSRHSSVERARPSSVQIHSNASAAVTVPKTNVVLTTTCTCGTQIPVHVKDSSVQTSTLHSNSSSGFTLKESTITLPEPNKVSQTSVKSPVISNLSSNSGSQTKQRSKDKKSVYVCYPNYSLPDLSFLKSVIDENSESVFLNPTEYKLPQDILNQKRPVRPKSYTAYESMLQKHLTKIKDWDSLNVLLPDDLKLFLSKTQGKGLKTENDEPKDHSYPKFHRYNMSSSYCNVDDATKLMTNFANPSYKRHMPRSILRKSSSVEQCEDRKCRVHLPTRCTSASSVVDGGRSPDRDNQHYKQNFHEGSPHCASRQKDPNIKQYSPCGSFKASPSPLLMQPQDMDKRYSFDSYKDENLLQDFGGKSVPYSSFNNENLLPSFEQKVDGQSSADSHMNCLHGKKAVKFCERSPTKNSKQMETCKGGRCCSCDIQHKSPECPQQQQEFVVSPAAPPDPISDSAYALQNFSGGGKFFQEALRRKTGLVENLRKATQIIFEHHKNSNKKGIDSSYTMGQKILTWLCPAVHTILSDGLLPSVQGFFGPLPNSPWKVAGASIKQGETRKDVEDLLNHVTSEKLLTDSTYRFNAFILGLLNLGCFEWWLGHLCACQSLICHHYHPTALLSLLALPAAVHLRHELKELVSPLSNLPFNLDITFETKATSGDNWKKYDEGNFRPEYQKEDLNLQFSPTKQNKINDFSVKTKNSHALSPCNNMNIRGDADECQVWPGITINPFPNAKFAEEFNIPSHYSHKKKNQAPPSVLRDTLLPRDTEPNQPRFMLCSSTDSGCSSQIDQQMAAAAAAMNDESPNVDIKEGQQFKMLRQKWEKISHGINKQAMSKTPAAATPKSASVAAAKPTISSSSKSKKKVASPSPPRSRDGAVAKTPTKSLQTPPTRRSQGRSTMSSGSSDSKSTTPAQSPVEGDKRRSQIPTLKLKQCREKH
ncbi:hypothetical protein JTE90_008302 [Oedothorax gibbosus]|uniref:RUN domain-containing protein n=1 Tax=Oedothorax gibbosus TaxID=931172 RepID=A0AAV6UGH4_9ARAC|nr:hypothetical protein JTE90_008302 [Oedothorax gibbosus]